MGDQTVSECASVADLIREHYQKIYRFAYRLSGSAADAEDVTQQTFLTAQTKLHQLREPDHAKSWLFTIARNVFLKEKRIRKHETFLEPENEPAAEMPLTVHIDEKRLQQALNDLPETHRTPLILFYFQEFSYKDIAEQLEVPVGTVMSRLARGKQYLRDAISIEDIERELPPEHSRIEERG